MYRCTDSIIDSTEINEIQSDRYDVHELKEIIILKQDIPRESLYYEMEDYEKVLNDNTNILIKSSLNSKTIKFSKLANIARKILKKYPALSGEIINLKKVKKDFPELTENDIADNLESIIEIYKKQASYEILVQVINVLNINGSSLGKISGYYGYNLNSKEILLLIFHPALIDGTERASKNALNWAENAYYGTNQHLTKADAYRHAIWNVLIPKYCASHFNNEHDATDWAKKFTDAHENGSSTPSNPLDNPMDFNNNKMVDVFLMNLLITKKLNHIGFSDGIIKRL